MPVTRTLCGRSPPVTRSAASGPPRQTVRRQADPGVRRASHSLPTVGSEHKWRRKVTRHGCNDVCVSGAQRGRGNQSQPHCCKAGRAGTTTTARAASHRSRPCCNTFFFPHASNSSRPTAVFATSFAGPRLSSFRPRFCGGPCLLLIPPAARRCARPAAPAPRPAQSRLARPEHAGPRGTAPSERLFLSAHVVIV